MNTVFSFKNSKTSYLDRPLFSLSDKMDLKRCGKYVALSKKF